MNYRDYIPYFIKLLRSKKYIQKLYGERNTIYTNMIGKNVILGSEMGGGIFV